MRSPAESLALQWRREAVLRTLAIAALVAATVIALWRVLREDAERVSVVHVQLAGTPSALLRDSLAALSRAGRPVSWSGHLAPLAVMAEPVREPGRRWRIAAVGSGALLVRDSLGPIDSLEATAALTLEPTRGAAQVVQGSTIAAAAPLEIAPPRRALVLGRVGWEPRFIITALEEAGWGVDARLVLGRERSVSQGDVSPRIERHDVVIVADSALANDNAPALARFVRAGGGLILTGEAAGARALRALTGARVMRSEEPETRSFEGHDPTHALPLVALGDIARDAILIADREGTPAIVARRVEAGRVMQVGYADTWRWRMEGEGRSVEEHRAYWSRLAGIVARGEPRAVSGEGGRVHGARADSRAAAPLVALIHAIGPPAAAAPAGASRGPLFPIWLGPVILLALLAEWGSRRRRGAL